MSTKEEQVVLAPTVGALEPSTRGPDLLNQPGVAYIRWNLENGSIIDVSPSVQALFGYAPDEFVRDSDLAARITHPDFASIFPGMVARWAVDRPSHVRFEGQYLARDGREVWLSVSGALEFSKDGELAGLSAVAQDITAIAVARRAAEDGRTLYSELFRSAPVALIFYDAESLAIEDANAFACSMYGIPRGDLCGTLFDARASEEDMPRAVERMRAAGKENSLHVGARMVHLKGDGSPFPVQLVTVQVHGGARPMRLAVVRDLTVTEAAEASLRVMRTALEIVPVPVLILDAEGLVSFANAATAKFTSHGFTELEGRPFAPLLSSRWESAWISAVGVALRGGTWVGKVELKGSHRRVAVAFHPLLSTGPGVSHVVAVFALAPEKP